MRNPPMRLGGGWAWKSISHRLKTSPTTVNRRMAASLIVFSVAASKLPARTTSRRNLSEWLSSMAEIEDVTRQTTQASKQATGAAAELTQLAGRLADLIKRFKAD